jgi:S-adenosyl methyltransferase
MPPRTSGSTAPGSERPLASYASVAHVARVYDYLLGGKDNFAVGRKL